MAVTTNPPREFWGHKAICIAQYSLNPCDISINYEIQDAYEPSPCLNGIPVNNPTPTFAPGTWAVAVVLQQVHWSPEVLYHLHRSCRTLGEKVVKQRENAAENRPKVG